MTTKNIASRPKNTCAIVEEITAAGLPFVVGQRRMVMPGNRESLMRLDLARPATRTAYIEPIAPRIHAHQGRLQRHGLLACVVGRFWKANCYCVRPKSIFVEIFLK